VSTTRAAALVFAAFLALAACGGGDDGPQGIDEAVDDPVGDDTAPDAPDSDDEVDDGEVGGDRDVDACALVTRVDAEELFGSEARQAEDAAPVELGSACIWENVGGDELGVVGHLLQVRAYEGEQFYGEDVYDDARPLDGIGDRAFVSSGRGLAGVEIQFLEGETVVQLSYSTVNVGVDEGDRVEAATKEDEVVALARQAADRL
jgi:hypothetical protein